MLRTVWSQHPVARCFVYEDGRETDTAYIDAYSFGDRLLEGVMVRVSITEDKHLELQFVESAKEYVQGLNQKYWLREATAYVLQVIEKEDDAIFNDMPDGQGVDLMVLDKIKQPV